MDIADPQVIRLLAQALIAPLALVIGGMALRSYVKVGSTASLLLSISFFMLAFPALLAILELAGLFHWPTIEQGGYEYVTQTIRILDALAVVQITAFSLLTSIYLTELRNGTMRLSGPQLRALLASLVATIATSLFVFWRYSGNEFGHPIWPFVSTVLSVVLMLVIVTLMFSFYRAKGQKSTLMGMMGFFLILAYQAYSLLSYQPHIWSAVQGGIGWTAAIAMVLSLSGYIIFLAAIVMARIGHD